MADGKTTTKPKAKRGFWYERRPDGRVVVCFKARVDREKFVQRLLLPKGVTELEQA
jgi:hypothetical protein